MSAVGTGPSPTCQSNTNYNFFSKYNMPIIVARFYGHIMRMFTSDCLVYVYKTY